MFRIAAVHYYDGRLKISKDWSKTKEMKFTHVCFFLEKNKWGDFFNVRLVYNLKQWSAILIYTYTYTFIISFSC